jgi:cytochrome-b5 reductase
MWRSFALAGSLMGGMVCGGLATSGTAPPQQCKAGKIAFSPSEFRSFRLVSSRYESHNTRRFLFAYPEKDMEMGMKTAGCIVLKFTDVDGKEVVRPYTPISGVEQKGTFELMIKRYPKSKMGSYLFSLRPGEEVMMKGPFQKFQYSPTWKKHVGMIAGGTGIAPMYQVIREAVENKKDNTQISLLYANHERKDILLANELCEMQKAYLSNFHLYITLENPPKKWLGGVGHISKEMIAAFLPQPGEKDSAILVCGPPGMMKAISGDKDYTKQPPEQGELSGLLKEMGYTKEQVFKF